MIGRVGRHPCQQLRGLLHSQQLKLMEAESRTPRDEVDIAAIKQAIENTKRKMAALGCGDD
jgi:anti-sigma28 factor (negative regulator of flagellin synthesis)